MTSDDHIRTAAIFAVALLVAYAARDAVEYKNRSMTDLLGTKICKILRRDLNDR